MTYDLIESSKLLDYFQTRVCIACGEGMYTSDSKASSTFVEGSGHYYTNTDGLKIRVEDPHMKRICRRCGYIWPEKLICHNK